MKVYLRLYSFFLALMVFWGAHAWFTWPFDNNQYIGYAVASIFCVAALLYKQVFKIQIHLAEREKFAFLFYVIATLLMISDIRDVPRVFVQFIPLLILASDRKYNEVHLKFISELLGIIIIIGAIPFILRANNIIDLPGVPMVYHSYNSSFINYFLFIVPASVYTETPRFLSVFLEPGYLGTLCAFLLYINHFDLKKCYNIFILIGLLLSLSLAGYVVLAIGFLFHLRNRGEKISLFIAVYGIFFIMYEIAPLINGGDNLFNEMIVQRLERDNEKGIVGNDRFHGVVDKLYEKTFEDNSFWFGLSKNEYNGKDISGSGYKIFILQYGLVPYIMIMLFFILMASCATRKKQAYFACVLLLMIFLQSTNPLSNRWLIPFLLFLKS